MLILKKKRKRIHTHIYSHTYIREQTQHSRVMSKCITQILYEPDSYRYAPIHATHLEYTNWQSPLVVKRIRYIKVCLTATKGTGSLMNRSLLGGFDESRFVVSKSTCMWLARCVACRDIPSWPPSFQTYQLFKPANLSTQPQTWGVLVLLASNSLTWMSDLTR